MVCRPGHENDLVEKMRHSCAHVMASAVVSLYPKAKVTIGPVIENGFYYDFDIEEAITPDDLKKIESKMNEIIKSGEAFVKKDVSRSEAIQFFKERNEKYKVEIIEGFPADAEISLYQHGSFTDLCKGPHVDKTSDIKAFHLSSVAGSYWRGDEKRDRLQRIYGTAFATQDDLKKHLAMLEEAAKRDHRKLGRELELFNFHPEAPASPFFYPKGAMVYNLLIDYLRELYKTEGYSEVITPQIIDTTMWERSGHLEHFKDNMYFTEVEGREMAVKPMNCPGHCLMFGEKKWSYRELPIRFADFGRLHRFERSGVTHGLTRVRTFCQDDAHIYCTPEQMDGEIESFLKLVQKIYDHFEFKDVHVALATRPEKYIGTSEVWDVAESKLQVALEKAGIAFTINPGEGAFYGPKIEFQVSDALGRRWQLGTLQVDYSMPERFNLNYVDSTSTALRPVMLHRAVLGSLERFFGILLEHTAGAFPFWLSPVQIELIPISDGQTDYALGMRDKLMALGYRVDVDIRNEKLGLKIREAQLKKIPLMVVLGAKEIANNQVSVRDRKTGDLGVKSVDEFLELLKSY